MGVRNFFIDGQWRYSVFTHGTDESDGGYYQEPEGPRKDACKALAARVYQEILKTSTFEGKKQTPLLNRIDIGVIPKKGHDSLHKTANQYFLNEIEMICTTWLDRYSPISVADNVATAAFKHSIELLTKMLNGRRKVPNSKSTEGNQAVERQAWSLPEYQAQIRLPPVRSLPDESVWIGVFPHAFQSQWATRCDVSIFGWTVTMMPEQAYSP